MNCNYKVQMKDIQNKYKFKIFCTGSGADLTNYYTKNETNALLDAKYDKQLGGIPKADLSNDVQTSLGKADTALQEHQDISGKEDKTNKVTSISSSSTDTQYPSAKAVYTSEESIKADLETQLESTNERVERAEMVYNALPKVNGSGEGITLDNTAETPLKMELSGNTSQFSTLGNNLFNTLNSMTSDSGITTQIVDNNNVKVTYSGTSTNYKKTYLKIYNLKANTDYSIKAQIKNSNSSVTANWLQVKDKDNTSVIFNNSYSSEDIVTFNTGENTAIYVNLYAMGSTSVTENTATWSNIQLNEGSYTSSNIPNFEIYTGNSPAPNPDYPQDIEVVKGNNTIKVEGKNLFNASIQTGTYSGTGHTAVYTVANDGKITQSETDNSSFIASQNRCFTLPAGTYAYKITGKSNATNIQIRNVTDNVDLIRSTNNTGTFTISAEKVVALKTFSSSDTYPQSYYVQIEVGSTATDYEPYQSQEYSVNLGSLELCKIGDYKDYIYKDNGSWYKHKEINKVVLNGSESWDTTDTGLDTQMFRVHLPYDHLDRGSAIPMYSNYYLFCKRADNPWNVNNSISYDTGNQIRIKDTSANDLATYKIWLGTHNTITYYVLNQPTNEPITDTTLINQLDQIEKAYAYQNQTNISQVNADKPFKIDAETVYDLSNLVTRVAVLETE